MSLIIKATVALQPGCRLRYDCPLRGDDWKADTFFNKYRGACANFVGYSEVLVGILDSTGRPPGRYINTSGIHVHFDGDESPVYNLNVQHFVVIDDNPNHAQLVSCAVTRQHLGDLPHPIMFYPGDTVRWRTPPPDSSENPVREIGGVAVKEPLARGGIPRYRVLETTEEMSARSDRFRQENEALPPEKRGVNLWSQERLSAIVTGEALELVARGNVWALYENPATLTFESDTAASQFWGQDGMARSVAGTDIDNHGLDASVITSTLGRSFDDAWRIFTSGEADVINLCRLRGGENRPPSYTMHRLHDCWAEHREAVRALTTRLWGMHSR